ncbi:MAG TPA: heme-binding protein [Acetobacteraceae bacterium]|nr:heme-binding protein [Acetobacteraceae bacterium]
MVLAACGSTSNISPGALQVPSASQALAVSDVQQIFAQATAEAQARNKPATIAVVDRVGNVLGIFQTTGAANSKFTINGRRGAVGGLEGINALPSEAAAIAKALTAAYFSSDGNAFSSRTAGQIIQQNFDPGQAGAPAGPLFNVQFSQLTCSDVSKQASAGTQGPHRSPLGFAAQPGGLPLYKNGTVVGAIGVIADGVYSLVTDYLTDTSPDVNELIAVAGTGGFQAPTGIRADHITAGGNTLIFDTSEALMTNPANAPSFASINGTAGALTNFAGFGGAPIVAGQAYGTPGSGVVPDTNPALAGTGDYIVVDGTGTNRFPPIAGTDGLMTAAEVAQIIKSTLQVANHTRAQVRQPLGSIAQVSVTVVDTAGEIVGYARSPDALVDSIDVVQQKARTALFFSTPTAATQLSGLPPANYLDPTATTVVATSPISAYVTASQTFFANPQAFANGIAFSTRAINDIATPFFPDGIPNTPNGPLAKPNADWSIFNVGLELDLVINKFVAALKGDTTPNCTGISQIRNGITTFGGGFPIYRGAQLVGAIGVSGDGTDQSDLIAFIGLNNAGQVLGTGIGNAPASMRADTLTPLGTRLRYVLCPQAPYVDSNAQGVCAGL